MNTTNFLYYDLDQQTWQSTTLEALATLNDPDLNIIPLDENNSQGKQTTWGNYTSPEYREALKQAARQASIDRENQQRRLQQQYDQQKAEQELRVAAILQRQRQQESQKNKDTNIQDIRDEITGADIRLTCRHIRNFCRLIIVIFWLGLFGNCATVGYISGGTSGLVIGLVVSLALYLIITIARNIWADEEKKSR